MDTRSLPLYQHPRMSMTGQSYNGTVPGSIPINAQMGNPTLETMGIAGAPMSDDQITFTHKTHLNKMQVQQNYTQLPIRKEVDDEGRIFGVVLPETPAQLPTETPAQIPTKENHSELGEIPQDEIKTEEDDDLSYFMETAHDTFLKVSSKELTLKRASDILGRPYSFVYTRYHEFCNNGTRRSAGKKKKDATVEKQEYYESIDEEEEPKKKRVKKKRGKKKGKRKYNKSRSTGKIFECEECPATFHSEYLIKTHSKVHLDKSIEAHTCTVCGVVCAKLLQLMRHRIEVHEEALQCPHCDSQFTIIASYKVHVRSHAGKGPWVCKECGKGYYSKFHLDNHSRKHTGERPFMCGYCEKTFMTLQHLKSHTMSLHEGIAKNKNYQCELCERKYTSASDLQDHMNVHNGTRPYACDMCDARFNFKTGLERHKVTHLEEEPYKCNLCPAGFYQKKDFNQHQLVHTGVKAFKCDLCDYSTSRKYTLEYHKYTHTGETPFKCDFYGCTAEYAKPGSLRHHKMQHGQPPKTCKVCLEKFPDLISLKRHMMIHTGEKLHACEQCSKTFVEKSSLKRHMYSHLYKPPGTKTKQVRQARKNPPVKKPVQPVPTQKIWSSEYQVPVIPVVPTVAENGHNTISYSLTTNAEDTNSQHSQPSFHPFTAVNQYSNLVVNNSWPSAMDHDELRRRLLSSFK